MDPELVEQYDGYASYNYDDISSEEDDNIVLDDVILFVVGFFAQHGGTINDIKSKWFKKF